MSGITVNDAREARRVVDVSGLPSYAFGHRDALWWGVWLLIAIEGTMFALLGVTYFYLRGKAIEWPPTGVIEPPLWMTLSNVAVLVLSCVPAWVAFRAALDGRLRVIQWNFVLVTLLNALSVALRVWELRSMNYNWNSHAYGSIVWFTVGMHTFHLTTGLAENLVMTALMFIGPVEKKHMLDVRLSIIYWWFVAVVWIPLWAMIFLDAALFRSSFVS